MATYQPSDIINPKRTLVRREEEAMEDPRQGKNAGDLPDTPFKFEKPVPRNTEGLAKALKSRK